MDVPQRAETHMENEQLAANHHRPDFAIGAFRYRIVNVFDGIKLWVLRRREIGGKFRRRLDFYGFRSLLCKWTADDDRKAELFTDHADQ